MNDKNNPCCWLLHPIVSRLVLSDLPEKNPSTFLLSIIASPVQKKKKEQHPHGMAPNDVDFPSKKNWFPNGDVTVFWPGHGMINMRKQLFETSTNRYPLIPQIRGKPWTSESWTLHFPHWFSASVYPRECYPTLSKSQPYLFMTQAACVVIRDVIARRDPNHLGSTHLEFTVKICGCHAKMMGLPKTVLV